MSRKALYLLLASLLSAAPVCAHETVALPRPGVSDQIPTALVRAPARSLEGVENQEVQFAWRLDATQPLTQAQPYRSESLESWELVSAEVLARGHRLRITVPGAIVRLSPADAARAPIDPLSVLVVKDGRSYANGSGMSSVLGADEVASGVAPFPEGSSAFRLASNLGVGEFELRAETSGATLVHVYEPGSDVRLGLSAERMSYLSGETLRLDVDLQNAGRAMTASSWTANVLAPDGRRWPLSITRAADGGYEAQWTVAEAASTPGLFEVEVQARADLDRSSLLRNAKTSFAVALPTARFAGGIRNMPVRMVGPVYLFEVDVEVATRSRYQLEGSLYGTDPKSGRMVPVATAQTAAVLETGTTPVTLLFGPDVLEGANVMAPWELRDLRLMDQPSLSVIERRELAYVIAGEIVLPPPDR